MSLADVVNEVWMAAYGGEPVTDDYALEMRVRNLACDRNDWAFNTRVLQKAFNDLESKLKLIESKNDNQTF